MTKVQADKPEQAGDLGERIDALLDAMQSACDRVARQLNGEPEPVEAVLADPPDDDVTPVTDESPEPESTEPEASEPGVSEEAVEVVAAVAPDATGIETGGDQQEVARVPGVEPREPEILQPGTEYETFADDLCAVQFEEATPEQLGLASAEPAAASGAGDDPAASAALDEQVGKLVDEAMVSAEYEPDAEGAIEDLDDELAALAEDLMNADGSSFEAVELEDIAASPEPEPVSDAEPGSDAVEAEPAEPVAAEPEANEPPQAVESDAADAQSNGPEDEAHPAASEPEPARPKRSRIEWPEWKPVKAKGWKKIPASAWQATRLYTPPLAILAWIGLGKGARAAEPWAIKGLEASAKPLQGRPVEVRQAVGWSALVTLFSALVAWAFVLTREPPTIETDQTPIGLENPAEAMAGVE